MPAELGRVAHRVEVEHVRTVAHRVEVKQAVLGGAGLLGPAPGRCHGVGVSVSEEVARAVPLVAAQY